MESPNKVFIGLALHSLLIVAEAGSQHMELRLGCGMLGFKTQPSPALCGNGRAGLVMGNDGV